MNKDRNIFCQSHGNIERKMSNKNDKKKTTNGNTYKERIKTRW